jgi:hypothetical protein
MKRIVLLAMIGALLVSGSAEQANALGGGTSWADFRTDVVSLVPAGNARDTLVAFIDMIEYLEANGTDAELNAAEESFWETAGNLHEADEIFAEDLEDFAVSYNDVAQHMRGKAKTKVKLIHRCDSNSDCVLSIALICIRRHKPGGFITCFSIHLGGRRP